MDAIAIARDTPLALLVAYILCTDLLTDARSIPSPGVFKTLFCRKSRRCRDRRRRVSSNMNIMRAKREGAGRDGGIALTNWSEEREELARKGVHDCV